MSYLQMIDEIKNSCIEYNDIPLVIKGFIQRATTFEELYNLLNTPTVMKFNNNWEIMFSAVSMDSRFFDLASDELKSNSEFRKVVFAKHVCDLTESNLKKLNDESPPEQFKQRILRYINTSSCKTKRLIIDISK